MDATTTITIGIAETIGIVLGLSVPMIGGFFAVWRASANAHEKIIERLCGLEGDMKVAKNDLDWLKHYARTGQPPPDKS